MAPRVTIKLATMNATVDSIRVNLDDICTEREFSAHFAERQSQPPKHTSRHDKFQVWRGTGLHGDDRKRLVLSMFNRVESLDVTAESYTFVVTVDAQGKKTQCKPIYCDSNTAKVLDNSRFAVGSKTPHESVRKGAAPARSTKPAGRSGKAAAASSSSSSSRRSSKSGSSKASGGKARKRKRKAGVAARQAALGSMAPPARNSARRRPPKPAAPAAVAFREEVETNVHMMVSSGLGSERQQLLQAIEESKKNAELQVGAPDGTPAPNPQGAEMPRSATPSGPQQDEDEDEQADDSMEMDSEVAAVLSSEPVEAEELEEEVVAEEEEEEEDGEEGGEEDEDDQGGDEEEGFVPRNYDADELLKDHFVAKNDEEREQEEREEVSPVFSAASSAGSRPSSTASRIDTPRPIEWEPSAASAPVSASPLDDALLTQPAPQPQQFTNQPAAAARFGQAMETPAPTMQERAAAQAAQTNQVEDMQEMGSLLDGAEDSSMSWTDVDDNDRYSPLEAGLLGTPSAASSTAISQLSFADDDPMEGVSHASRQWEHLGIAQR